MKRLGSIAGALAVGIALALVPAGAGTASEEAAGPAGSVGVLGPVIGNVDDFSFASMHAEYVLGRDADGHSRLDVVETFVAEFPEIDQNRGMRRAFRDSYNGQPLLPEFVSITDGDGNPRPAEVDEDDGVFTMTSRADDYVHGTQVYVFTYRLQHVTWDFADGGTEFYWNINGNDWRQQFGEVSVALHMGPEIAAALTDRASCYRGISGSTDRCEITIERTGNGATVRASTAAIGARETMTIAVGFADGTFTVFDPSYFASPAGWVQVLAGLGLLGTLVGAIVIRSTRLRDSPGRGIIIAEYDPPPGIDALQSAVLLGRSSKAIPAEVLEQAIVGSIRIVETEKRRGGSYRLRAELVDPTRSDENGRRLLDGLFGPGAPIGSSFEFGRSSSRLERSARQILDWTGKELRRTGMYRAVPRGVRLWPALIAFGLGAVAFVSGIVVSSSGHEELPAIIIIVGAIVVIIAVIGLLARKPKSPLGAEVRDHLRGVKEFIEWAEADRIRMLQSPDGAERRRINPDDPRQLLHLYESLLPYAVVFGLEKEWGKRLAVLYADETPVWYSSSRGFNAALFAAGVATLSASASSSSSSSGGSSGGGSAGGGGGGGGGGGV